MASRQGVVKKSQKKSSWIDPSFGDFGDFSDAPPNPKKNDGDGRKPAKKRKQDDLDYASLPSTQTSQSNPSQTTHQLWVDKYAPRTKDDLAVHKKKVAEVEGWLQTSLRMTARKRCSLLLLTGPAGVGKTATIRVLTREMKLDLHEWANPITGSTPTWDEKANRPEFAPVGGLMSESQAAQFRDFLLRANRYSSLQLTDDEVNNKAILIEEFPNIFFRDTTQFHSILRDYVRQGGSPLVFILSDSAGGDSNERLLFPKDIQAELNMANISFNPVAPTLMTKVLQKIVSAENFTGGRRGSVSKSSLESLVSGSSGDIRAAVNALQFNHHSGLKKSVVKKKSAVSSSQLYKKLSESSSSTKADDQGAIGARDNSLFLFRALGKILYCKRDSAASSQPPTPPLPAHLSHHERLPLLVNPEDVVERSQMSGPFFMSFLHQNYLEFYPAIEDVVRASEYQSDADYLTIDWANRSILQHYAASVATRGLMHSNSARMSSTGTKSSGLGWKPLHKPAVFAAQRKMRDNCHLAKCLFRGKCWTPEDLHTQLLPYLAMIKTTTSDPGQFSFLQDVRHFKHRNSLSRQTAERLEETDVTESGNPEEEGRVTEMDLAERSYSKQPLSQNGSHDASDDVSHDNTSATEGQVADSKTDLDEDIIIEDFDDL